MSAVWKPELSLTGSKSGAIPSPHALAEGLGQLGHAVQLHCAGRQWGPKNAALLLRLHDPRLLWALYRGDAGRLGEAYIQGALEFEGPLRDWMAVLATLVGDPVARGRRPAWYRAMHHWRSRWWHQKDRDTRAVRSHYELPDAFYALWLDPQRVYSCAYYSEPAFSLAKAQAAKLEHICRKLQLSPGQRLLDVGAGWGGLLCHAAQHHGVRAVGITLSRSQFAHVQALIERRRLQGRVEIRLMDYRQLGGAERFDRIVSVGMSEHVGRGQLGRYFGRLHGLLQPGGLLLNHCITAAGLNHTELGAGMGRFMERHVFPGGELSHVSVLGARMDDAGLELLDAENLRPHYARTLWDWSDGLEAELPSAIALAGLSRVRAFRLYLAGSALGFERGWLSLYQLLASRPHDLDPPGRMRGARSDYLFSRAHMYGQAPTA